MRCHAHMDRTAVAACVYCGKGLCPACAVPTGCGRLVCSRECADGLRDRKRFGAGCFLLWFGGLLVALSVYFGTRQAWSLAVVMVLYSMGCLIAGAAMVSRRDRVADDAFEPFYGAGGEIRWRAGIALQQAHRFRKAFSEFLALYAKHTGKNLTIYELEWANAETRRQTLEGSLEAFEGPQVAR